MTLHKTFVMVAVAGIAGLAGCVDFPGGTEECSTCHTGPALDQRPFRGLDDVTAADDRGVGAHTAHLMDHDYTVGITCADCHQVPATIDAEDHFLGGRGEVRFGALAATGVLPRYDRASGTCSQVYCHGARVVQGVTERGTTPAWGEAPEEELGCNGCHASPPATTRGGLPHPPSPACEVCHPTANEALELVDKTLHINGVIDILEDG